MIDGSRGEPALLRFFTEEFEGTLVSDFWGAYNAVACAARQGCLVHLLRDIHTVERSCLFSAQGLRAESRERLAA
jgi:hypothetical protein